MKKMFLLLAIGATVSSTLISCSKDKNNDVTPTPVVEDKSNILTYRDVNISLDQDEGYDACRFFSTKTGKSYKRSQITKEIAPLIDLVFYSDGSFKNLFISPTDVFHILPLLTGATNTIFINHVTTELSVANFDQMKDDSNLKQLNIDVSDDKSFGSTIATPSIVLFKNGAGKKGAIKIKSVHEAGYDPRIVVDVIVQK